MGTNEDRYGRTASLLHWLIGVALIAEIIFGFLLDDIAPRNTPSRAAVINLHKSFGIVLGVLTVLRLLWRLRYRPPRWLSDMPAWERRAARFGHHALYLCMLVVPASGYIASNFSKHGVRFFGQLFKPWGPDLPNVYAAFNLLHVVSSWLFTALVLGHVLIALKHALLDRDGSMARISPWAPRP